MSEGTEPWCQNAEDGEEAVEPDVIVVTEDYIPDRWNG